MKKKVGTNEDYQDDQPDRWKTIRELFDQLITKAKGWEDAQIIDSRLEIAKKFHEAYPEQFFIMEDIRLALHDLNIAYERNEHNNKFYYLANWR